MFVLGVNSNVDAVTEKIRGKIRKQVPFATSLALNNTAQLVKSAELAEMRRVFDRPTPWTLNSLFVKPSNRREMPITARVWKKDPRHTFGTGTDYLNSQIFGGERNDKAFENALQRVGILPDNMQAIPGPGATLDQYGNIARSQVIQIMSCLQAFGEQGYRANVTEKSMKRRIKNGTAFFFVPSAGGGGVWSRQTPPMKLILFFRNRANYPRRFEFFRVANEEHRREFKGQFARAFKYAIDTAI